MVSWGRCRASPFFFIFRSMIQLQHGSCTFYINLDAVYTTELNLKFTQRYNRDENVIAAVPTSSNARATKFDITVPVAMEEGQYLLTVLNGDTPLRHNTAYVKGNILTPSEAFYTEYSSSETTTYYGQ